MSSLQSYYGILSLSSTEKFFIYRKIIRYHDYQQYLLTLRPETNVFFAMAYEKKIPVDLDCPLRLTMSLIESKWKSCILDELRSGSPMRPSEIHKCLPEAVPRVLDIQLKEMVEDGLVTKTIFPELPPRSEYMITELGKSLLPIIDSMLKWGEDHFDIFEKKYGEKK